MALEKQTNSIKTTVVVAMTVGSIITTVLTTYYSTTSAVKDAFNEFKNEVSLKIRDLENEDKLIRKDIHDVDNRTKNMEDFALKYVEAIKPEEPKFKPYK